MTRLRWLALALLAQGMLPVVTWAEGWKMPNLNPLARRDSHPANVRLADDDERPWWKPKLPAMPASRAKRGSQPSPWARMSRGTKAAWAKTTDVLNPFDDENDKPKAVTGYNTAFTRRMPREEKQSSWWPFGQEKPKNPETVHDFLGLDRPY